MCNYGTHIAANSIRTLQWCWVWLSAFGYLNRSWQMWLPGFVPGLAPGCGKRIRSHAFA